MDFEKTDDLCEFVDALDVQKEEQSETSDQARGQSGEWKTVDEWSTTGEASETWSASPEPTVDAWTTTSESAADSTWLDITTTFDNWLMRLVDIERRISTSKSLKGNRINLSIDGMLEDGLIGYSEASELRFIGNCWTRLMNAHTLYSAGCHSYKYDILSTLLDLYSAKQIKKELCIEICEQL